MAIKAIVVPVDPEESIRLEEIDRSDIDAYRRPSGDSNRGVLTFDRPPATLHYDEEGKLRGLPVNVRATALLWAHNSALRDRGVVVGPAFIVGPPDQDRNDTSVPQDLIDLLMHTKRYRVQVKIHGETDWHDNNAVFTDWFETYAHGVQLAQARVPAKEMRVIPDLDNHLREQWYQIGRDNPRIRAATDPPFTRDSFVGCYSIEELGERIDGTVWPLGAGLYYHDLCFIQQAAGGDEWLAIRHGIPFESMPLKPSIEDGTFVPLMQRLLAASKEQCQQQEY